MSRHILRGLLRHFEKSVPIRRCHTNLVQKNVFESNNNVLSSPFPDIEATDETLTEYLFKNCLQWADRPSVTCGATGRSYNYGITTVLMEKCSHALITKLKMSPGDRIGLILPNIPEFPVLVCGALNAGMILSFANPLYTVDEIARQFADCGVTCIAVVDQLLPLALKVKERLKDYKGTISVGGEDDAEKGIHGLLNLLTSKVDKVHLSKIDCNQLALIPYSSGTTGMPKGVMLSHKNLVSNLKQITTVLPKTGDETMLAVPPFFHIYGFNGVLNYALNFGHHLITLPKFSPEDYLTCLMKYRPNVLFVVPSLLAFLGAHPAVTSEHLASVRDVIVGAAATTESVRDKFFKKCGRSSIKILPGYGMTESSPVTLLTGKHAPATKMDSVGQLVPSTEAKLVSVTDGRTLGPNEPGELLLRGPQIMLGYYNNEKATSEIIDSEGWLHTGDVCYYDEDQYFYIVDRTKELIKVKGNQVSPTELENVIMELEAIADAAVIGIPHELCGEIPKAFVVLKPKQTITEKEIYDAVAAKVAKFKRLDGGIVFIGAIPRNQSGKIMRNELKSIQK